ncbi:hypothetical protein [Mesorhizobium sp. IMUNJ 23232]|uniref:hypothetical protein n=1 Tax=Mesorhizobium sp. IMUNJ 23232 TaxID=3376064 RepID=UPI00379EAB5D
MSAVAISCTATQKRTPPTTKLEVVVEPIQGEMIKKLVEDIEAATVGMSVPRDPKYLKIKAELKKRLSGLFVCISSETAISIGSK